MICLMNLFFFQKYRSITISKDSLFEDKYSYNKKSFFIFVKDKKGVITKIFVGKKFHNYRDYQRLNGILQQMGFLIISQWFCCPLMTLFSTQIFHKQSFWRIFKGKDQPLTSREEIGFELLLFDVILRQCIMAVR